MASSRKSPQADAEALFQRFSALVHQRNLIGSRIAIAYSGGRDSTVLLHLCVRLAAQTPFSIQACHVHHGLSPSADAWLAACHAQCEMWSVPFTFVRLGLDPDAPDSLESRARAARYAVYADLDVDFVMLGHHRDDQVETVLYRLARGAGVQGAAGMPMLRRLGGVQQVFRPLLNEPLSALVSYASVNTLRWVEDESNQSVEFDRNYLRHEIAPRLLRRFPAAGAAIARAARHFSEAAGLLDALAEQDAGVVNLGRLPVASLTVLEPARQRNLLRWFLAQHDVRPDERQLHLLIDQLLHAGSDTQPCLRLASKEVHRYRDEVWVSGYVAAIDPLVADAPRDLVLDGWRGRLSWQMRVNGLRAEFHGGLQIRPRCGGEQIRPRLGGPKRQVKLLLQEAGVPPWLRSRWPLLWRGEHLVALAGIAVAAECQAHEGGYWPQWHPDDWPGFGK